MKHIALSYDSNLRYLPLVYFLPEDTLETCPTLRTLPRKVREVIYSEKMMEKEIGWGLQALMNISSKQEILFFNPEYINETMKHVAKRAIEEQGWQSLLDVQREMPCDEDFERWDTNIRKDFLRKWYHSRSKRVQMISLEACMKNKEEEIYEIEDTSGTFEDKVIAENFCECFKATISKRDMEILELRVEGVTLEEIARRLGYKNHSGVLKRMNAIKKKFVKYENKYGQ